MRRKVHAKSGLFLLEVMISILFFALTSAIFIQVFVKSDAIRTKSESLFMAQKEASSMAEQLKAKEEPSDVKAVYYDRDWNQTGEEEADYMLEIESLPEKPMMRYAIRVSERNGEEIYTLDILKRTGDSHGKEQAADR